MTDDANADKSHSWSIETDHSLTVDEDRIRCSDCRIDIPNTLASVLALAEGQCDGIDDTPGVHGFEHANKFALGGVDEYGNKPPGEWLAVDKDATVNLGDAQ